MITRYCARWIIRGALAASLCVVSVYSSDDDFDFAAFFNSLLEEDLKEHTPPMPPPPSRQSQQQLSAPRATPATIKELEQTISPNKKGNFITPLRFEPTKKDGPKPRVKVPQQKREAFLYYNQKLINLLDSLRSNLDLQMKTELSDFVSVSDSIIERILAIDRQYLLRTFYHADFNALREKIYNELTKKSSKKSLRSLNKEFAKIKEKAAEKTDEEELTFTARPNISLKQRERLIKDIRDLTTQKLKPIADELAKITGHKQAVDEKNKKIATMKEREKLRPRATARTPWRPSYGGGRGGRRGGRGSSDYDGSRGRSGGGGYYGGGYRPSWDDHGKDYDRHKTPDTTPSGSSSSMPAKDTKKKDDERIPDVFSKIKNLLEGSGKPLTDLVNALAQARTSKDVGTYLFDKNIGSFIAHPNFPEYLSMIHEIDRELMAYDTSADITKSATPDKKGAAKSATPTQRQQSELETRLRNAYANFRQKALVALSRAENAFCITEHELRPDISPANPRLPIAIFSESLTLPDTSSLYQTVRQARAHLASSYPKQAEQLEKTLTSYCKKYDQETLQEFSDLVEFCREYPAQYLRLANKFNLLPLDPADVRETKFAKYKHALQNIINRYPRIKKVITENKAYPHLVIFRGLGAPDADSTITMINDAIDHIQRSINTSWGTIARSAKRITRDYPTKTIADIVPQLQQRARAFATDYNNDLIEAVRDADFHDNIDAYLQQVIDNLTAAHRDTTPALDAREKLAQVRADLERDGKAEIESAWKLVAPADPAAAGAPDPDA